MEQENYFPVSKIDVTEDIVKIYGVKTNFSDGSVNVSCEVVLSKEGTESDFARTITDRNGYFEIFLNKEEIIPGIYQLRYYGSGSKLRLNTPSGDWELVDLSSSVLGKDVLTPIKFSLVPLLEVLETSTIKEVKTTKSLVNYVTANFDLTRIRTSQGELSKIKIQYREYKDTDVDEYEDLIIFDFDKVLENVDTDFASFKYKIPLNSSNQKFDFRALFLNRGNVLAIDDNGDIIYAEDLEVYFDGISDYKEIIEVKDFQYYNNNQYNEASNELNIEMPNQIKIRFRNMYKYNQVEGFMRADGISINNVDKNFWRTISKYVIFIFISNDGNQPTNLYPALESDNGKWFLFKEIDDLHLDYPQNINDIDYTKEKQYYEIFLTNLPLGKYVWFWLGVKSDYTNSKSNSLVYNSQNILS